MSFDIYIGEAVVESEWGTDDDEVCTEWVVKRLERPDAPFKPDMTENSNSCHPGYGQWAEFVEAAGLQDVFFSKPHGLMCDHPGIKRLTTDHLTAFAAAEKDYIEKHPDHYKGLCEHCDTFGAQRDLMKHDELADFNLYRLEWLVWWTRWALENCVRPAMYNH